MQEFLNFLNDHDIKKLQQTFITSQKDQNWSRDEFTSAPCSIKSDLIEDSPQQVHNFMSFGKPVSPHYTLLDPVVENLSTIRNKKISLIRAKVNVLSKKIIKGYNMPHVDSQENNFFSGILYLNDSDGYTFLFDQFYNDNFSNFTIYKKILPQANKLIIFDSNRYHASSNPYKNDIRTVINLVFC